MNSEKPLDSALKCFIFFLISQPLIYLIQDVLNGSKLFMTYYRNWVLWTVACLPMGFIGHYMKKDKWWGIIILLPMLALLFIHYYGFLSELFFTFPVNLISTLFCLITMIVLPIAIFDNKIGKYIGLAISVILVIVGSVIAFTKPYVYTTEIFANSEEHPVDGSYKAYLTDSKYGDVEIIMDPRLDDWVVKVSFKKTGKTQLVLEDKDGKETRYDIDIIGTGKYDYELVK